MQTQAKTWLGVLVIVAFALAAGMFIYYREKILPKTSQPITLSDQVIWNKEPIGVSSDINISSDSAIKSALEEYLDLDIDNKDDFTKLVQAWIVGTYKDFGNVHSVYDGEKILLVKISDPRRLISQSPESDDEWYEKGACDGLYYFITEEDGFRVEELPRYSDVFKNGPMASLVHIPSFEFPGIIYVNGKKYFKNHRNYDKPCRLTYNDGTNNIFLDYKSNYADFLVKAFTDPLWGDFYAVDESKLNQLDKHIFSEEALAQKALYVKAPDGTYFVYYAEE